MVLESIQVLIPFSTDITTERLLLFHPQSPRVWCTCFWIDDGKRTIGIIMQLLIIMSMLYGHKMVEISKMIKVNG